ncbi:MAG TPA: hypothetical protein VG435_19620 [Acidimicrobiales bacterium]|jgi:hypothetical protein|nr:hypothetical protein [Acidimicrobiales bacterium]
MRSTVATLPLAGALARPVAGAETRLVGVPAPLATLFPEGGVRKGTTVAVGTAGGGASLALAMAASVTSAGGWVAAVGWPSLGLVAATELGVDLRRLALVPTPGDQWATVTAALVDGFDLIMLCPAGRVRIADARRLAARVRERRSLLMIVDAPGWPELPDLRLTVEPGGWQGLGAGHGCLTGRRLEVVAAGRRVGGRERRREVWLPAAAGGLQTVEPSGAAAVPAGPVLEVVG